MGRCKVCQCILTQGRAISVPWTARVLTPQVAASLSGRAKIPRWTVF
jgi:hypothetical protein